MVCRIGALEKSGSATVFLIATMAATSLPPSVTTAVGQALPGAEMAVGVLRLSGVVMELFLARTALTNRTLGRIAPFAQRRAPCPAQVFLATVQNFAMDVLLVLIIGTNYSPPVSPKLIL